MEIVEISVDEVFQDPNNVRLHDDKNLDAIKGSLKKFGQQKPIVIDENNIILAGNGTHQSAKALGWKTIACVRSSLKDFDKMAFALADNRTAELASWDMPKLQEQVALIDDPELIGFDDDFKPINPNEIDPEDAFGNLGEGDKDDDIEQITFTLSGAQASFVRDVIKDHVGILDENETGNPNKNGNALYAALEKI